MVDERIIVMAVWIYNHVMDGISLTVPLTWITAAINFLVAFSATILVNWLLYLMYKKWEDRSL